MKHQKSCRTARRRGVTVVLFAILLVVVLSFVALSIDLGYVCAVKGDLQAAADAGALAGTGMLPDGEDIAESTARRFANTNLNNRGVNVGNSNAVDVQLGSWSTAARTFTPGGVPVDAVQVTTTAQDTPLFFGRVAGGGVLKSEARAVATYRPRDIMLVLDVSGSMQESRNGIQKMDELRESVGFFLEYVRQANSRDRVGFTYYSTTAHHGMNLSYDLNAVEQALMAVLVPNGWTNISDGMMLAREEMIAHRRSNASPLMVVLTDGAANTIQPENTQNVPEAKSRVLAEAELALQEGIPVFTMALDSLTAEVDVALMAQVAEITGTESYHIIAGEMGVDGNLQLHEAFRRVALNRPLRLVE
jgi:Mg-chelatase subunit ChlD